MHTHARTLGKDVQPQINPTSNQQIKRTELGARLRLHNTKAPRTRDMPSRARRARRLVRRRENTYNILYYSACRNLLAGLVYCVYYALVLIPIALTKRARTRCE